MNYSVQKTESGRYGIMLKDEWLQTHFDPIQLECDEKLLIEELAGQMTSAAGELEISNGRILSPKLPLYNVLSFNIHVRNGFDLVTDDYHWIISCDPIFHPVSGSEQSYQLRYFDAAIEWLELIGAKYRILPQRFESREELIEEDRLDEYLIDEKSADIIFDHWNILTQMEKAAFYYIYLNSEHNFIASFLALKEMIDPEAFGKLVTASIGVAPEFSGVTKKTFEDGCTHYTQLVSNVMGIRLGLIK